MVRELGRFRSYLKTEAWNGPDEKIYCCWWKRLELGEVDEPCDRDIPYHRWMTPSTVGTSHHERGKKEVRKPRVIRTKIE